MAYLKNHPGMWLSDAAAASLERFEADHGVLPLNSAGRHEWEQQNLIDRWDQGGTYNRPPYLYAPARPADESNHVKNGGIAVDTSAYQRFQSLGQPYGWFFNYAYDVVHAEYDASRDQKLKPSGANQVTRDRQTWLNQSRKAGLVVDGVEGAKTTAAYKDYQTFLKSGYGYAGEIDGRWGVGTQAAHSKFYAAYNTPAKPASPAAGVPSGLRWQGIQEMLRKHYGYVGLIDGIPGGVTIAAFQRFLTASNYAPGLVDAVWGTNTGKAAQRWLKARWGYTGAIDNDWGPGSRAAWARAEAGNAAAF